MEMVYSDSVRVPAPFQAAIQALEACGNAKALSLYGHLLLDTAMCWRPTAFPPGNREGQALIRAWTARPFPGLQETGAFKVDVEGAETVITYVALIRAPWYLVPFLWTPRWFLRRAIRASLRAFAEGLPVLSPGPGPASRPA